MGIPKAVLACVLGTLAIGTTGCGFPVITLNNVRKYALTGVDYVSAGALTHSAQPLDLSLKIIK